MVPRHNLSSDALLPVPMDNSAAGNHEKVSEADHSGHRLWLRIDEMMNSDDRALTYSHATRSVCQAKRSGARRSAHADLAR